jgi:membrane-bound ClpP family serine protease
MSIAFIIALIVIGLALIVVEVVVLPGITVAGIAGMLLIGFGIFFTYRWFGNTAGTYALIGTSVLFIIFLIYALRAKTWDRLSLHSEIDSRVNVVDTNDIKAGDRGMTVSRLAPIGKILIHDKIVEGKSKFGLIDENKEIEIIQVNESTIIVQESKSSSSSSS